MAYTNDSFYEKNNHSVTSLIESRRGKIIDIFFDLFLSPMQQRTGGATFPNLWEYETIFQCIMESYFINQKIKKEYDKMLSGNPNENQSSNLIKLNPLKNIRILEIGGYFSLNIAKLGAIAEKKDSAIDEAEFITLENYKDKLGSGYDITISKEVLDRYSGIENGKPFKATCRDLLTVFSNITRKGGISIHEGRFNTVIDAKFLNKIGFDKQIVLEGKKCEPPFKVYVFRRL